MDPHHFSIIKANMIRYNSYSLSTYKCCVVSVDGSSGAGGCVGGSVGDSCGSGRCDGGRSPINTSLIFKNINNAISLKYLYVSVPLYDF